VVALDVSKQPALIDGHVHQHRALLHGPHHIVGHQPRGLGAGNQHGAHHQIRFLRRLRMAAGLDING
jgi:hypothetical protein